MRGPQRTRRPAAVWAVVGLLAFLALGAFVGGVAFVTDPTGASIGAQLSWLEETPVSDFLLPGLFLLGVFAIGSLLVMSGLVWRPEPGFLGRFDAATGHHWAWLGAIALSLTLITWILYEFTIFSDRIVLQPLLIGVGAAVLALAALPSMRRFYATQPGAKGDDPR